MFRRNVGELKAEDTGNGLVLKRPLAHFTSLIWLGLYVPLGVYE